jgi:glycopeptide antibiotics resistance protein
MMHATDRETSAHRTRRGHQHATGLRHDQPHFPSAVHYAGFALAMFVLTVYGSLIPFTFQPLPFADAVAAFRQIGLYNPADLAARGDWVVSVAVFMTLSYLMMAALCVDRARRVGFWVAPAVVLVCGALVVAIEFTQIFFPPRTVSLNDIIVESVGVVLGPLVWIIGGQRITRWMRRLAAPAGVSGLAARLLPGYIVVLVVALLMPFDLTVSAEELAVKLQEGKIWLVPFSNYAAKPAGAVFMKIAINVACFFPLGFLRAMAWQSKDGRRQSWLRILLLGLVVTVVIEFFQLLVYSRVCDTTDIATGTLAVLLGWITGRLLLAAWRTALIRSPGGPFAINPTPVGHRVVLAVLFLAWFGGALYLNWKPFNFTTDRTQFNDGPEELPVHGLRRMSLLPLVDYYWGSKYQALDQFLKKSALFVPLGILCAFASTRIYRPGVAWAVLITAVLAGVVIETGRYFLPAHSASVTDILLQTAGAWLGFKLTQHVRALLWAEGALYGYLYQQF